MVHIDSLMRLVEIEKKYKECFIPESLITNDLQAYLHKFLVGKSCSMIDGQSCMSWSTFVDFYNDVTLSIPE